MKAIANAVKLTGIVKSRLPHVSMTGKLNHLRKINTIGDDQIEIEWNRNRFRIDLAMHVQELDFTNSSIETPAAEQLGKILRAKKGKAKVSNMKLVEPNVRSLAAI